MGAFIAVGVPPRVRRRWRIESSPLFARRRRSQVSPLSRRDKLNIKNIYTTRNGVRVGVLPGVKSAYDFRVLYTEPHKQTRTPRHVHMIVELYVKQAYDE